MNFLAPEWADLRPIVQDDGQTPLCPIAYEEGYRVAMNYFRALVNLKEFSQRALDLTTFILYENASHYTVWYLFAVKYEGNID